MQSGLGGRPRRKVPVHNLRPNHRSWSPPALISFDTETRWQMSGDNEVHEMRLWCARYSDRRAPKGKLPISDESYGYSPEDFAIQVHKWTRDRKTVWACAHNLNFDLCTTDMVAQLEWLGWQLVDFAIDGKSPFLRLRQGEHNLTVFDSHSWMPVKLAEVGHAVKVEKPDLPANADSDEAWLARCRCDTEILHTAMLEIMEWWDANELGNWSLTGAASGWNAMRHVATADKVLIRPDKEESDADRTAIYGGRRYCYRHSQMPQGRYIDVDIEKAYTVACRDLPLPVERIGYQSEFPTDTRWLDSDRYGIIATVRLRTRQPRYPVRHNGLIWYPAGEYETVLASPEIREARERGELVSIGPGWLHKLGRYMQPWADWCIRSQHDSDASTPAVCKIVLRNWGRSNAGKWAQRSWDTVRLGSTPKHGLAYQEAWDHYGQTKASIVDYGGYRWQVTASQESENGYPGVLAFIESYVRVALARAIDIVGEANVICCDTDGMIVTPDGADRLSLTENACWPFTLREKRVYTRIEVLGPQHLRLDAGKHMAGIPGSAEPVGDGRLWARTWPKLAWQIQNGRPGNYVRPVSYYRLSESYIPGWKISGGNVLPIMMQVGQNGGNQIMPWSATSPTYGAVSLTGVQHGKLEAYHVT